MKVKERTETLLHIHQTSKPFPSLMPRILTARMFWMRCKLTHVFAQTTWLDAVKLDIMAAIGWFSIDEIRPCAGPAHHGLY